MRIEVGCYPRPDIGSLEDDVGLKPWYHSGEGRPHRAVPAFFTGVRALVHSDERRRTHGPGLEMEERRRAASMLFGRRGASIPILDPPTVQEATSHDRQRRASVETQMRGHP